MTLPSRAYFTGFLQVTEDGDIVYVFLSLQTSAMTGAVAWVDRQRAETLAGLKVGASGGDAVAGRAAEVIDTFVVLLRHG